MKQRLLIVTLLAITLLLSGCRTEGAGITINNAWARPGFEGGTSAVYFVIENSGDQSDSLHSAESTVAAAVELHESMMDSSGTMTMHEQHQIDVPAKDQIAFQPGGLHVMLINLTQDLNVGDRFNLTLSFDRAGLVPVDVQVRQP
jgi:periplasmic copper chaperone A